MPFDRKEYMKKYNREYHKKKPRDKKDYSKNYYKQNKDALLAQQREYYHQNKEKINEYKKLYNQKYKQKPELKEQIKKYDSKSDWKRRGVIWKDEKEFESIWKEYTTQTHCEFCYTELNNNDYKTKKCLDHDHKTGKFRFILCWYCNIYRQSD